VACIYGFARGNGDWAGGKPGRGRKHEPVVLIQRTGQRVRARGRVSERTETYATVAISPAMGMKGGLPAAGILPGTSRARGEVRAGGIYRASGWSVGEAAGDHGWGRRFQRGPILWSMEWETTRRLRAIRALGSKHAEIAVGVCKDRRWQIKPQGRRGAGGYGLLETGVPIRVRGTGGGTGTCQACSEVTVLFVPPTASGDTAREYEDRGCSRKKPLPHQIRNSKAHSSGEVERG